MPPVGPAGPTVPFTQSGTPPQARPGGVPLEPTREERAVPMYGRAPVPQKPQAALYERTAEQPIVPRRYGQVRVSWHRPSRASLRQLSDGWGFTALGLLITFCGWGTWAAAGGHLPLLGLLIVLAVAMGVFVICRLLGRLLFAVVFKRERRTARVSHAFTGLFLAIAGFTYLAHTSWITQGFGWLHGIQ
jgi:hypothetical protein